MTDHGIARDQIEAITGEILAYCKVKATAYSMHRFPFESGEHAEGREPGPRLPKSRYARPTGVDVADARFWLSVVARAAYCAGYGDDEPEDRKTLMYACKLLGLSWMDVHKAVSDVRVFGADAAAQAWAPRLTPPDMRYVGFVYCAAAVGRPDVLKVGFSTTPAKRMKALSRMEGAEVRLLNQRPATMLHEWALHMNLRHAVKPEWYPTGSVPEFVSGRLVEAA